MHTPEQARQLWCPMVRVSRREKVVAEEALHAHNTAVVGGCNTDPIAGNPVPASCRCIADQCAMWRWRAARQVGYCGLAVNPVTL